MWNDFNRLTKKSVELLVPKNILKKDEKATNLITSKIERENLLKQVRSQELRAIHDGIYDQEKHLRLKKNTQYSNWGSDSHRSKTNQGSISNRTGEHMPKVDNYRSGSGDNGAQRIEHQMYSASLEDTEKCNLSFPQSELAAQMPPIPSNTTKANKNPDSRSNYLGTPHTPHYNTGPSFFTKPPPKVNTDEYSEFRGLHIPLFNKDSAAMDIPYTRFVLTNSSLARNRVTEDVSSIFPQSNLVKHTRIRENPKIVSHLPPKKVAGKKQMELLDKREVGWLVTEGCAF